MSTENDTLGDALPKEIQRCKELVDSYMSIGPTGAFGAGMIRGQIRLAEKAIEEGDVVGMLRAYNSLKECKS